MTATLPALEPVLHFKPESLLRAHSRCEA